jgi:hypothetical protein
MAASSGAPAALPPPIPMCWPSGSPEMGPASDQPPPSPFVEVMTSTGIMNALKA